MDEPRDILESDMPRLLVTTKISQRNTRADRQAFQVA
jgi:hypothetical protein